MCRLAWLYTGVKVGSVWFQQGKGYGKKCRFTTFMFCFVMNVYILQFTENPSLDAWLGARQWVTSSGIGNVWITRAEYQEKGGDYLKEHMASNRYLPHPVLVNK